jgi:hypothetical protein
MVRFLGFGCGVLLACTEPDAAHPRGSTTVAAMSAQPPAPRAPTTVPEPPNDGGAVPSASDLMPNDGGAVSSASGVMPKDDCGSDSGCLDEDGDGFPGSKRVCWSEPSDGGVLPCSEDILSEAPDGFLDCDDEDPELTRYVYADPDGDGYGDATKVCFREDAGWTRYPGDCDNDDPTRHPKSFEVFGDGVDTDCDGRDSSVCVSEVDDFLYEDGSVGECAGSNLAIGQQPCLLGQTIFAVENRAAAPFAGEVTLVSGSETPTSYPSQYLELAPGERKALLAAWTLPPVALGTDAEDCDPDDNVINHIHWPNVP